MPGSTSARRRLEQRIEQGWRRGELTRPEVGRLQNEMREIRSGGRYFWSDGRLTPRERGDLNARLDHVSRLIQVERHDGERRNGSYNHDYRADRRFLVCNEDESSDPGSALAAGFTVPAAAQSWPGPGVSARRAGAERPARPGGRSAGTRSAPRPARATTSSGARELKATTSGGRYTGTSTRPTASFTNRAPDGGVFPATHTYPARARRTYRRRVLRARACSGPHARR